MYILDLLEGRGEKRQCNLECGAALDDWANKNYVALLKGSEMSAG